MKNRYSSQPDPEWQRKVALRKVKDMVTVYERLGRSYELGNIFRMVAEYVGATSIEVKQWCFDSPDCLEPHEPSDEGDGK
jgi:hypothetical protein